MGLFTKSLIILALAVSTPLVYRQFVDDNIVKHLSSHITNYKAVDQFLRQSAGSLDNAKQYLNKDTVVQIQKALDAHVRPHIEPIIKSIPKYVAVVQEKFQELKQIVSAAVEQKPSKAPEKTKRQATTTAAPRRTTTTTKKPENKKQTAKQQAYKTVNCPKDKSGASIKLWSKDEIAKHKSGEILLAFMGLVYNVTSAADTFYGPSKEYSMFSGRDATRAYLTGNFTHDLSDDISDLDESSYGDLKNWSSFYTQSYPQVGRLEGPYYDSQGCPTAETKRIYKALDKLGNEDDERKETNVVLPECNSEWNGDTKKSRVWCSKASGGVERNWVGVPRIYKDAASGSDRCVCYSKESKVGEALAKNLKVYPNCEPNSYECNL